MPPSKRSEKSSAHAVDATIVFHPLTPERWADLEVLFGARGACGGCWCMTWRLPRARFEQGKGAGNRAAFRRRVQTGRPPGVLAYVEGNAAGWCAIAPRAEYDYLSRSRVLRPVDDRAVWSVSCLFVAKSYRGRGLSVKLLRAAVEMAGKGGAEVVEGYPVIPYAPHMPDAFAWTGTLAAFRAAGFEEVARGSPKRPIVRAETRSATR